MSISMNSIDSQVSHRIELNVCGVLRQLRRKDSMGLKHRTFGNRALHSEHMVLEGIAEVTGGFNPGRGGRG